MGMQVFLGLRILAFPCNDFGKQEPDSLSEIKEFCTTKYGVKFEIYEKVHAKGNTTEPYTTLNKVEPEGDVEWNFEKFLIGKDSKVIARFKPGVKPCDENLIAAAIKFSSQGFTPGLNLAITLLSFPIKNFSKFHSTSPSGSTLLRVVYGSVVLPLA